MVIVPMDQVMYEEFMMEVSYAKLLPFIMEDFISRADAKQMMNSSNLAVKTTVAVNPGQIVATTGTPVAQSGSTTSPGKGDGIGKVTAAYTGSSKLPADQALLKKAEATIISGSAGTDALVKV